MDVYVIAIVVVGLGLFMVGRTIVWWYFGIDEIVEHLASIDESLKQLPAVKRHEFEAGQSRRRVA